MEVDIATVARDVEFLFEEVEERFAIPLVQFDIDVVQTDNGQLKRGFESASECEILIVGDFYADIEFRLRQGISAELGKVERKRLGVSELDVCGEIEGGHFSLLGKVWVVGERFQSLIQPYLAAPMLHTWTFVV